jgi:hypothetical protein
MQRQSPTFVAIAAAKRIILSLHAEPSANP